MTNQTRRCIFVLSKTNKAKKMGTQAMIFPGVHSTQSVETIFIEGYRLDICEVNPAHYDLLYNGTGASKPMGRYFLEVENKHIVSYKTSEGYFAQTGQCRWDFFCHAKSDIKKQVQEFESLISDCIFISAKIAAKPAMSSMLLPKLEYKKTRLLERYGVKFNYNNHK